MKLKFTNPNRRNLTGWQTSVAEQAVQNASSESPVSSLSDVRFQKKSTESDGRVIIVEVPDNESASTITAFENAFLDFYGDAEMIE